MSLSPSQSLPAPMCVTHRFVPGLRFDDVLAYQTCAQDGAAGWNTLPLDPQTPEDFAGDGAWWCVRRCAAVLLRRPWKQMQVLPHLPLHRPPCQPLLPGAGHVAHALWSLLPGWEVVCHGDAVSDPVAACAPALLGGGSALLLLQSQEAGSRYRSSRMFWTWVVGLELRGRVAGMLERSSSGDLELPDAVGEAQEILALLTMPFDWPVLWSCGYSARVHRSTPGLCDVGGMSGRWHMSRCRAVITLAGPYGG